MKPIKISKRDKLLLIGFVTIFSSYVVISKFLWSPYKNYKQAQLDHAILTEKIESNYQKIIGLTQLKKEYLKIENYLQDSKKRLSVDGSDLLKILTKESPIESFLYSSIEMNNKEDNAGFIFQYPFEISFYSNFQQIGKYLIYQESSLPISYINDIEINLSKKSADSLNTKISGVIFKVN